MVERVDVPVLLDDSGGSGSSPVLLGSDTDEREQGQVRQFETCESQGKVYDLCFACKHLFYHVKTKNGSQVYTSRWHLFFRFFKMVAETAIITASFAVGA